jgi:flagellar basal-body rod protein FlgB
MTPTTFRLFDGLNDGIERALDLRQTQHTLSAANLANVDTPGYRAREVPFADILGRAVDAASAGDSMPTSDDIRELDPVAWAVDGNSVSAEAEAVKLTENSVLYNALTTGMSHRLALLRFAASDGRA